MHARKRQETSINLQKAKTSTNYSLSRFFVFVFFPPFSLGEAFCVPFFLFNSASCLLNKSSQVGLTTHD